MKALMRDCRSIWREYSVWRGSEIVWLCATVLLLGLALGAVLL